jgi:hypothetical protein
VKVLSYHTWYEFKKSLQEDVGRVILNDEWLKVKPKTALPWDERNLQMIVTKISRK